EEAQREVLEGECGDPADEPELRDVVLLVDVEDEQDARRAQPAPERREARDAWRARAPPPARREERDAVDDLEDDVGVAAEPAQRRPRGAREDGEPRAHPVDRQPLVRPGDRLGPRIRPRDDRHAEPGGDPARDLAVQDGPRAAGLGMRPVAIHEDQDVPPRRHAGATVPSRLMPARPRIAAFVALLLALAAPAAALAQSGGGG